MHILFVCTGNICRSPTAERLAVARNAQGAIPDFRVSSAGTRAVVDGPIHPEAAAVLADLGGDPANFAARQLTSKIAGEPDLILVMTEAHRETVLDLAPRQLHRCFTLIEAAQLSRQFEPDAVEDLSTLRPLLGRDLALDVPDPIGRNPEFFAAVGLRIAELVDSIIDFCHRASGAESDV